MSDINLRNENFFYEELVNPIESELTDFIFGASDIKLRHNKTFHYKWPYPVDPDEFDEDYSTSFYVSAYKFPVEGLTAPVNVAGYVGTTDDAFMKINVKIEHEPNIDLNDCRQSIIGQLKNTLAHEIHHLTQEQSLKRPNCPSLLEQQNTDYLSYFTSAYEIPAFVVGFRAEAKYYNVFLEEQMWTFLTNYVMNNKISIQEATKIFDVWSNHQFDA